MGNTWVVDMSHWDYPDDEANRFPARTLKFWGQAPFHGIHAREWSQSPNFEADTFSGDRKGVSPLLQTGAVWE
jgi:hypothetical protein